MVKDYNVYELQLWGNSVGALLYDDNRLLFEYMPQFIKSGLPVDPISLPLVKNQIFTFPSHVLPGMIQSKVPHGFAASFQRYLAITHASPLNQSLSRIKKLSIGALDVKMNQVERDLQIIDFNEIIDTLSIVKSNDKIKDERAERALCELGGALSGSSPKITFTDDMLSKLNIEIPENLSGAAYVLKLSPNSYGVIGDAVDNEFTQIEYAYSLMAKECGISVTPCELLQHDDYFHLISSRIDSTNDNYLHTLSLQAALENSRTFNFADALSIMRKLKLKRGDAVEFFRRIVFNVVARNQNDHADKTVFLMNRNGEWSLGPAFGLRWSCNSDAPDTSKHCMVISGKDSNISRSDLLRAASEIQGLKGVANDIIDEVVDIVSEWSRFARKAGVTPALRSRIAISHKLEI